MCSGEEELVRLWGRGIGGLRGREMGRFWGGEIAMRINNNTIGEAHDHMALYIPMPQGSLLPDC